MGIPHFDEFHFSRSFRLKHGPPIQLRNKDSENGEMQDEKTDRDKEGLEQKPDKLKIKVKLRRLFNNSSSISSLAVPMVSKYLASFVQGKLT